MIDDNPPEFVPGPPAIDYHVFHEAGQQRSADPGDRPGARERTGALENAAHGGTPRGRQSAAADGPAGQPVLGRSKVASANGSARMSAVAMCTRSLAPSSRALRSVTSFALPDWSALLQISTPVTRPVVNLRATAVSTAPRHRQSIRRIVAVFAAWHCDRRSYHGRAFVAPRIRRAVVPSGDDLAVRPEGAGLAGKRFCPQLHLPPGVCF